MATREESNTDAIDRRRAFNRTYACDLVLVVESPLGSGLKLTVMPVLHDLDQAAPCRAKTPAVDLGLDAGYIRRFLLSFEKRGWLGK